MYLNWNNSIMGRSNISVSSWRLDLSVDEIGGTKENHQYIVLIIKLTKNEMIMKSYVCGDK